MRSFEDGQGRGWQAALLDGSYGKVMLVFSALAGDELRCAEFSVENQAEGSARLARLELVELRELLAQAPPWRPGQSPSPAA